MQIDAEMIDQRTAHSYRSPLVPNLDARAALPLPRVSAPRLPKEAPASEAEKPKKLEILHLEDCLVDRDIIRRVLAKEGLLCQIVYADSKAQFETALREKTFDIILSDFAIPAYDGLAALAAARSAQAEVPFLFVSGTIGEERAVDGLKSGAT